MAFAQAACRQTAAPEGAMQTYGFGRVVGAARIKATVLSEKRTDAVFIGTQHQQQQDLHGAPLVTGGASRECSRRVSSLRSRSLSAEFVAGPALLLTGPDMRTMQSMLGKFDFRNISRVTRLMVLRVTARGAKRFAAMIPRRACGRLFSLE